MSSTLCRYLYLSAFQRVRNVMTLQHLSNRVIQHPGQHTLRTAAGLSSARGITLARPCLHFAPCVQLHFSRGVFTKGTRSLFAVQAEAQDLDTTETEPASRLAGSDLVEAAEGSAQQKPSEPEAEVPQTFPGVQADSGVEVVSVGIPTEAVLSATVTESNAPPAVEPSLSVDPSASVLSASVTESNAPPAVESSLSVDPSTSVLSGSVTESNAPPAVEASLSVDPSASVIPGDWESVFQAFLDVVKEGEYFEGKAPTSNAFSISILKRGILNFARARQDILFSLPADKIQAVLTAGPPYSERKLTTATKRLSTTFGEGKGFLGQPEGSFQDLTRFIIAAAYSYSMHKGRAAVKDTDLVDWQTHQYSEDLMTAVTSLLPDVVAAARREPDAEALAKAEASALVREQKAITPAASLLPAGFRPSNAKGPAPTEDRRQDRSRFFMEKGWDGFTDPNTNIKPGDWSCAACNQHNFARNQDCFKCGAPKAEAALPHAQSGGDRRAANMRAPDSSFSDRRSQTDSFPQNDGFGAAEAMPEGDWDCSECGTNNFARRGKCFKCGRPRAMGMMEGQRPGDWACPSCSANNFSRRTECFRCQQPKPEDQGYRAQSRRDNFAPSRDRGSFAPSRDRGSFDSRPVYEAKPGDWDCSACGASNFARRGECFKCGEPKRGGGSSMTTSGRSAGRVFDNKQDESSWFDADSTADSSTSASTSWDPRTSLGAEQPKPQEQNGPASFNRGTPRRGGGSSRGSGWDRGGASVSRGGRGGSSSRGGSSYGSSSRGGGSYGSSSRGGGSYGSSSRGGSSYGSSSRGRGAPRGRGYSSQSDRGGRGSADSRDGGSFSGEPIPDSKSRSFSQDSFGGEWGDLE